MMFSMFSNQSSLEKMVRKMANTLDDILAEQAKSKTELENLKVFVQALKDKIDGGAPDLQVKIDEALANAKSVTEGLTAVMNQSSAQL